MEGRVVKIISSNIDVDWYTPFRNRGHNSSIGTGFFIDDRGHILTCAHVVAGAIKIYFTVPLESKDQKEAVVVSICYDKDIALLRSIDYRNRSYFRLSDSDRVIQKDKVHAAGYPLGQDRLKLTAGIVSGRQGRYIQTDTPINSGNSGGPLLNKAGEVIGINTAKMSSFMADNIGYTTPINDYLVISEMMFRSDPKIIRKPMLVAEFHNIDKKLMEEFPSLDGCGGGFYLSKIYESSPLHTAGVRSGDVLCSFDGLEIDNFGEVRVEWNSDKVHLFDLLDRYKIGDRAEISFWSLSELIDRNEQRIKRGTVEFTCHQPFAIKTLHPPFETIDYEVFGGLVVVPLTLNHLKSMGSIDMRVSDSKELIGFLEMKNRFKPVLIISTILEGCYVGTIDTVFNGSVIERVNGRSVSTLEEYRSAMLHPRTVRGTRFVELEIKNDVRIFLSLEKMLEEEEFLSRQYKYPVSSLFGRLSGKSDPPTGESRRRYRMV